MQIAIQIKILPSKVEAKIINDTLTEYIAMVNDVVSDFVDLGKLVPKTSAHIKRDILGARNIITAPVTGGNSLSA